MKLVLIIVSLALLARSIEGCFAHLQMVQLGKTAGKAKKVAIPKHATEESTPWEAEPRTDQYWIDRHNFLKQYTATHKDEIKIMFFGDSHMEGWEGQGKAIWNKNYAPLDTANYGIAGDRTEHLLYRIQDGEVKQLKPKLVVLKIGTNNRADSVDDVAMGIKTVVNLLQQKVPTAKVLLLGILPRNDTNWFNRVRQINAKIAPLANEQTIFFLDMFNQFITSTGELDMSLFKADKLHLTTLGYSKWAEVMGPLFNHLIQ